MAAHASGKSKVGVGVIVGVGVMVGVEVTVGVDVMVDVDVSVEVGVLVLVAVAVEVAVGVGVVVAGVSRSSAAPQLTPAIASAPREIGRTIRLAGGTQAF
jgi:hypothetical protein